MRRRGRKRRNDKVEGEDMKKELGKDKDNDVRV